MVACDEKMTGRRTDGVASGRSHTPFSGVACNARSAVDCPSLGTWTSQDPARYISGANTYQFVESGPVGNVDASGLSFMEWFSFVGAWDGMTSAIGTGIYGVAHAAYVGGQAVGHAAADWYENTVNSQAQIEAQAYENGSGTLGAAMQGTAHTLANIIGVSPIAEAVAGNGFHGNALTPRQRAEIAGAGLLSMVSMFDGGGEADYCLDRSIAGDAGNAAKGTPRPSPNFVEPTNPAQPPNIDLSFFGGKKLQQVCIGANEMIIKFDGYISITIMSPIACTFANVERQQYDDYRTAAGAVVAFLQDDVISARGDINGTLTLEFHVGRLDIFDDSKQYESYIIKNGDKSIVV